MTDKTTETAKCDCTCQIGNVVRVHVTDPETGTDWGEFNYCQEAIRADRSRGLHVEILTPEAK